MIEIDGQEAGGQVLRTASALSVLTGKAFKIKNIRGARPEPGLKVQHMEGLKAIAELCEADVSGLAQGSTEMNFFPKELKPKDLKIEISTAGSIGLVLQSLLILVPKLSKPIKIKFDFQIFQLF